MLANAQRLNLTGTWRFAIYRLGGRERCVARSIAPPSRSQAIPLPASCSIAWRATCSRPRFTPLQKWVRKKSMDWWNKSRYILIRNSAHSMDSFFHVVGILLCIMGNLRKMPVFYDNNSWFFGNIYIYLQNDNLNTNNLRIFRTLKPKRNLLFYKYHITIKLGEF